jgi:hypothetical protein
MQRFFLYLPESTVAVAVVVSPSVGELTAIDVIEARPILDQRIRYQGNRAWAIGGRRR